MQTTAKPIVRKSVQRLARLTACKSGDGRNGLKKEDRKMLFIKEARDGYAVGLGYQPDDERRELFWSDTLTNARAFSARLAALLTQPKIGRRLGPP